MPAWNDNESYEMGHVEVVNKTDLAVLFRRDDGEEIWVPRSVIHEDSDELEECGDAGELVVKEWWAVKEGF